MVVWYVDGCIAVSVICDWLALHKMTAIRVMVVVRMPKSDNSMINGVPQHKRWQSEERGIKGNSIVLTRSNKKHRMMRKGVNL